ncbi:MAG: hypothetical protein H6767_03305 [Candidatus Peribacteria bacterium]|nr:MAG: hypothetical protein H6767_03305 [Candidatus Peribacteria bacterium]
MKKIMVLLLAVCMLASCGEDTATVSSGLEVYTGSGYMVQIPSTWTVVTDHSSVLPKPSNGDIELAVTSNETQNGFANNLLVLSQEMSTPTSSKEYSIVNNVGAEREYLNYTKLDTKDFTYSDGDAGLMYVFTAKYSESAPELTYIQTAKVCGATTGYFMTIALPLSTVDTAKYEAILKTFWCREESLGEEG